MPDQSAFNVIGNRYIEQDLPVITHYNSMVRNMNHRISTNAIFEFGLMGKISSAILLVCNANSGLDPHDYEVLNDKKMIALADAIRSGKTDVNITLSARAREMRYPMFTWANRYYSAKRDNLISLLTSISGITDKDSLYEWFSRRYAMRDIFYYHSHALNIRQWENSCKAVTGEKLLPHQRQTLREVREAIQLNKPIILGLGRNKWLEYVPELRHYKNAFVFCQYCWFTSTNLMLLSDYRNFRLSGNKTEFKQKAWTAFCALIRKEAGV